MFPGRHSTLGRLAQPESGGQQVDRGNISRELHRRRGWPMAIGEGSRLWPYSRIALEWCSGKERLRWFVMPWINHRQRRKRGREGGPGLSKYRRLMREAKGGAATPPMVEQCEVHGGAERGIRFGAEKRQKR